MTRPATTRMWEARAAEGRTDELVAWALANVPPGAAVYRSADRVVVVADGAPELPAPPPELVARPPHAWDFERVPNRP